MNLIKILAFVAIYLTIAALLIAAVVFAAVFLFRAANRFWQNRGL